VPARDLFCFRVDPSSARDLRERGSIRNQGGMELPIEKAPVGRLG
jgi:hypothetical protein